MQLPAHTVEIIRYPEVDGVVQPPVCSWCQGTTRAYWMFYLSDRGTRRGCNECFFMHRETNEHAKLLVVVGESPSEIRSQLEGHQLQTRATDVDVFLYELAAGLFDDDLDQILTSVKTRYDFRAKALATTLRRGDRIRIVGDIRPQWMQNSTGTIKGGKGDKFEVEFDVTKRTYTVPKILCRPLPKEAVA